MRSARSWAPPWATQRSSSFAKPLPRRNAPTVLFTGKSALCTARVEEVSYPSQRTKQLDKKNYDALSIPSYVIKKSLKHCAKHGAPERKLMYRKAKETLQKVRQPKHGGYQSLLERWHNDYWLPKFFVIQRVDRGAHHPARKTCTGRSLLYIAAPKERARYEKNSVLSLNKEGVQGPMNQRPDFAEAKQKFKRLHDEYVKETSEGNTPIHPTQRTRQRRNQQIEGLEEYDYQVDPQTGWRTYSSRSRENRRQPTSSSSSTQWEQHDDRNKSWNSWRSSSWTEQ